MLISPFVVLALNYLIASFTHTSWGDYLAILYFTLYGVYCIQNFIGCREYHCLITGPGFLLAAIMMTVRDIGIFDRGFGPPYIIFALSALLGHLLERRYVKQTGSKFLLKKTG
jgi:hypothetical protein